MECIVSSVRIVALTEMTDVDVVEQRLSQLVQMEEERFIVGLNQNIEKKDRKHGMVAILRLRILNLEDLF